MIKNPLIGYFIHSEKCAVCGIPANPGVTFKYKERGENPTHMQGVEYNQSFCTRHIPEDKRRFLAQEMDSWQRTLQTPL